MKPIFKEEMRHMELDKKFDGYLWISRRSISAYDKKGDRILIGRKPSLRNKRLNKLDLDSVMTHKELAKLNYPNDKIKETVKEAKDYYDNNNFDKIIVNVSGGKDSTIIEYLVDKHNIIEDYEIIFGNTSNETHHTYKYVKDNYPNATIVNPDKGFYQFVKENNFVPNRFARACCTIYKEGNISEYLDDNSKISSITGMRRSESNKRSGYSKVREFKGNNKQKENWLQYNLIIDWEDMDVWSFLLHNEIPINKLYRYGYNRVGCTNCPYRTPYELSLNKEFLPKYWKRWQAILKEHFIDNGIAVNINCTLQEYLDGAWRRGVVREEPTDEVIEEFAEHRGIGNKIARSFFKSSRCSCGKRLSKDIIALNLKLLGRGTSSRLCLKCLSKELNVSKKELKNKINEFKNTGCNLF